MRHYWFVLALGSILALAAEPSGAAEAPPYLRLLQHSPRLHEAWRPWSATPLGLLLPAEAPRVPALVQSRDPAATVEAALRAGARVGTLRAGLLPLRASLEVLLQLATRPEVERLEVAPPRVPLLDLSRPEVGADRVEAGLDLPFPVDGSGVLVGLVDTGLDYHHLAFQDAGGRTRVQAIWDQAFGSGDPPPGHTVGALCDRHSLVLGQCDAIDLVGHGTHVASTAAGSETSYRGMAPGAGLVAVGSLDFALLTESVGWLFDEAERLGQPMVVNLSLGGHYGPHDGTDLESQGLSALVGPGRIVLASAGNEGNDLLHLGTDPAGESGKTAFVVYSGLDVSAALFTCWLAPGAELAFAVGVERDSIELAATGFAPADGPERQEALSDGPAALGRVLFAPAAAASPETGKQQIDIAVEPAADAFEGGALGVTWTLKFQGQGEFDCWSAAPGLFTPPAHFSERSDGGWVPGDNRKSVAMPAVAPGVVAVAAYATRDRWTDREGQQHVSAGTAVGELSFFSSHGPSADPARTGPKPEIAAPGEFIVAAMSRNSGELSPGTRVDETHIIMRGTSMSCPHAVGITALLLQVRPELDPDGVRAILSATARHDAATGSELPNDRWGYGKIDAHAAVARALGVGDCDQAEDCAEGWRCDQQTGRCQQDTGGCGCNATQPVGSLGPVLLGLLAWRRRLTFSS